MLIFRFLFLFLESARVTFQDSRFKVTLIYITLALGAATEFILCLKQRCFISCHFTVSQLSSDGLPLRRNTRFRVPILRIMSCLIYENVTDDFVIPVCILFVFLYLVLFLFSFFLPCSFFKLLLYLLVWFFFVPSGSESATGHEFALFMLPSSALHASEQSHSCAGLRGTHLYPPNMHAFTLNFITGCFTAR